MRYEKWLKKNTVSLKGKLAAVTGTTGGIGRQLCRYLAYLGADIILIDRNKERSNLFKSDLEAEFPTVAIELITADLEDIASVENAVEALKQKPIDLLFHNAGAYSIQRHKCSTGFDNVFQINFASPYYMTSRLLPHLRQRKSRVVAVSSIAHNYSKTDPDDIDFSKNPRASRVYGNAKRYLTYSFFELFKNETEASLSVVHPGITFTNITTHYPKLLFAVIKHPMKVIFMNTEKAALSVLSGAVWPTVHGEWIGPRFFNIWGKPRKKALKTADSEEIKRIGKTVKEIFTQCDIVKNV